MICPSLHPFSYLAETLDPENFSIRHLLVHPVPEVLEVGQAPPVLVEVLGVLLLQLCDPLVKSSLGLRELRSGLFCVGLLLFLTGEEVPAAWVQTDSPGDQAQLWPGT